MKINMITAAGVVALFMALSFLLGLTIGNADLPRLVGRGCVGAVGPIYAEEEDMFPTCRSIERTR